MLLAKNTVLGINPFGWRWNHRAFLAGRDAGPDDPRSAVSHSTRRERATTLISPASAI
jgi:hypothetical protein